MSRRKYYYAERRKQEALYDDKFWGSTPNGGHWTIFENGDVPDRSAIFYVAANNDNNTILMRYGAVATKINIDWIADKRTIGLVNNIYEFEPTNDYNFASKKYVDDRTTEETEEETFNKLLEAGLILGSVELEDGSMLIDNDGNSIIF
jgi:hypothetical protein